MQYKISKSEWEQIGLKMNWMKKAQEYNSNLFDMEKKVEKTPKIFTYQIDLNERGSFRASVSSPDGKTVFTIRAGNELGEDETSIFEDGYMKHIHDMKGLKEYLVQMGIMSEEDKLKNLNPSKR